MLGCVCATVLGRQAIHVVEKLRPSDESEEERLYRGTSNTDMQPSVAISWRR